MTVEAKEKGRTAFKEEHWEDAIQFFTNVLETDPTDVTCLAIRSSAYQKQGDLTKALADADAALVLQPAYVRGYIRKACVLRATKDYSAEVDTYSQGLEHCPGDDSLTKGLSMACRLRTSSSNSSTNASSKTTQATRNAAVSRRHHNPYNKNNNNNYAQDLTSFVQQTKLNLQLKMVTLQAQLDVVKELTERSDTTSDKMDLLFSLITTTNTTTNDDDDDDGQMTTLTEVAKAIQKASVGLPFESNLQTALAVAVDATPEPNMTQIMTRPTMDAFLQNVVQSLGTTSVGTMSEFVVYQVLFRGAAAEDSHRNTNTNSVSSESQTKTTMTTMSSGGGSGGGGGASNSNSSYDVPNKSVLNDRQMQALFVLFDKDADATVDFKEVAIGLYPLTKSMGEAAKKTAGLLLMVDRDDERVLTYEQFAKLMLAVAGAFGLTFHELADQLTVALADDNNQGQEMDEQMMQEIMVAEEAYVKAVDIRKEEDQRKKTLDALSYSRTRMLFQLWDVNGDGTIDFQELLHGLRRYQKSAMGSKSLQDAERDALMIMGHDKDRNQALDEEEFAYAMADYAEAVDTSLHELIDFMCVVSSRSSTASEYEVRFEETMQLQRVASFRPKMGTILDRLEDGEEEEEDNW